MNLSPRPIWFGIIIPGKKMIKAVAGDYEARDRGEMLLDNYKEGPDKALTTAALALVEIHLHEVRGDAFGPAGRDLLSRSSLSPDQLLFGALITDIRDFLKFRFRAKGGAWASPDRVVSDLREDSIPTYSELAESQPGASPPEVAIDYAIVALDAISKGPEGTIAFQTATREISKLLWSAAKPFRQQALEDFDRKIEAFIYGEE